MKKQEIKRRKRIVPAAPDERRFIMGQESESPLHMSSTSPDPSSAPNDDERAANGHSTEATGQTGSTDLQGHRNYPPPPADFTHYHQVLTQGAEDGSSHPHSTQYDRNRKRSFSTAERETPASDEARAAGSISAVLNTSDAENVESSIDPDLTPGNRSAHVNAPQEEKEARRARLLAQKEWAEEVLRNCNRELEELDSS